MSWLWLYVGTFGQRQLLNTDEMDQAMPAVNGRRWVASDIMHGGTGFLRQEVEQIVRHLGELEKRENEVPSSAAVHTSFSGFQYIIQPIVVLLFLSSCTCFASFLYLIEAVSVLLFPDSSTCTSRFLYNLCFFLVLVSGTFLNSVVTSMYVFYTNLSGVFPLSHTGNGTQCFFVRCLHSFQIVIKIPAQHLALATPIPAIPSP